MVGAPTGEETERRRGNVPPSTKRTRDMLRLLQRLALALATVLIAAGVQSPVRDAAPGLSAAAHVVAVAQSASAPPSALTVKASRGWHGVGRSALDLRALELDDDDEDRSPCDAVDDAAPTFARPSAQPRPDRPFRREAQRDPSRVAIGTGLPRGPPA
jgi:hypothetical protein